MPTGLLSQIALDYVHLHGGIAPSMPAAFTSLMTVKMSIFARYEPGT